MGKVNPLYKKDSSDNPSNYRPISILSVFSKIFEKLMYKRLYQFLDSFEILYPLQFGFREKHSTSHALVSSQYRPQFLNNQSDRSSTVK